ncbi:alpha/beta hydrolase [Shewanella cyperi]|uniref:Alpha/beta hydrolase n=1 Tax=Shewanella cyperi TaxID=2814292 RepID=A0A974XJ73_9GAMM|nr:alpha/beta hydrolase [Shewanella cyperi]QSX29405.1 alpha/beta hydrolase [Shewanella cyperi]QSX40181.1 alpha/beta hydrolase [Shewanella cyperi]
MRNLMIFMLALISPLSGAKVIADMDALPVEKAGHYLFFFHGAIAEGTDRKPLSNRFGVYDFDAIIAALDSEDYFLVAEQRPAGTKPEDYARKVVAKLDQLLAAGVAPEHISLVGFSRGGGITTQVSTLSSNDKLGYAVLAGCSKPSPNNNKFILHGQVLSIYEIHDDLIGSCKHLVEQSPDLVAFDELPLDTGLMHGEFYLPREEWLTPLKQWLQQR